MIINPNQMEKEIKVKMRGGDGDVHLLHFVSPKDLKNARLLAKITIPCGASIGEHEHINETEYYIILKGKAIVVDDGVEKEVKEGDVVVTGNGGKHSIRNTGSIDLEMIAAIITY
ncbi:MAG: cupin [Spirochaetes bacterium GWC1_27_15]|nr:MAG: cupin [Spirochaetes bacterium GWC1_27_15]